MALLGQDPMRWLGLSGDERRILTAVYVKAIEIESKRQVERLKFLDERFLAVRKQIANIRL